MVREKAKRRKSVACSAHNDTQFRGWLREAWQLGSAPLFVGKAAEAATVNERYNLSMAPTLQYREPHFASMLRAN